jgi:hypothetical protein
MRSHGNIDNPIVVYWVSQISPAFAVEYEKSAAAGDPNPAVRNC